MMALSKIKHSGTRLLRRTRKLRRLSWVFVNLVCLWLICVVLLKAYYAVPSSPVSTQDVHDLQHVSLLRHLSSDMEPVRVVVAMIGTRVDHYVCYAVASAYFTNIPVLVAGYGERFTLLLKMDYVLSVATLMRLRPSDVMVIIDADVMFTGENVLPYIDKFILQSPPSVRELDAKAIREGRAMAPSVFSTENGCYAPQLFNCSFEACIAAHKAMEHMTQRYVTETSCNFNPEYTVNNKEMTHYINTGTSIHRLWSLRLINASFTQYMREHQPNCYGDYWQDDQTSVVGLYLDMREWEIRNNVFCNPAASVENRTHYGLYAGQIQLDMYNEFAAPIPRGLEATFEITSEKWESTSATKPQIETAIYSDNVQPFIKTLYQRVNKTALFHKRTLWYNDSIATTINVTPALFSVMPRHLHNTQGDPTRLFPLLLHYAGGDKNESRTKSMIYLSWYLPMLFDKTQWEKGRDFLLSMPMELWSATRRVRVRYADVCPQHPFSVRPTWD